MISEDGATYALLDERTVQLFDIFYHSSLYSSGYWTRTKLYLKEYFNSEIKQIKIRIWYN